MAKKLPRVNMDKLPPQEELTPEKLAEITGTPVIGIDLDEDTFDAFKKWFDDAKAKSDAADEEILAEIEEEEKNKKRKLPRKK